MCLVATSNIKTAKKDIKCYKVLRIGWDDNITSPYRTSNVISSVNMTADTPFRWHSHIKLFFAKLFKFEVEAGIHSFVNERDAVRECDDRSNFVVVCTTIPAGSKYVEGYHRTKGTYITDYPNLQNYVSDALVIDEVLHYSTYMSDYNRQNAKERMTKLLNYVPGELDELLNQLNKI